MNAVTAKEGAYRRHCSYTVLHVGGSSCTATCMRFNSRASHPALGS